MSQLVNKNQKSYGEQANKYLEYINEHRNNVAIAYRNLFTNPARMLIDSGIKEVTENIEKILDRLNDDIELHDMSKYSDDEFYAYRQKFNMTESEKYEYDTNDWYQKMIDENFENAWKHHYCNNYHHPKFWKAVEIIRMDEYGVPVEYIPNSYLKEDAQDMTVIAILHMICDWEAMSIKFGGKTTEWYINKAEQERKDMSENTRKLVKQILEYLYDTELPDSVL